MLVDPKALSLGFSLESFQKKRHDAFPANALVLQFAHTLLMHPVKTGGALYPWALLNPLTLLVCDSFGQPAHLGG